MKNDWITNRRPMEADGDQGGDVRVRTRPDRDSCVFVHWSLVSAGTPWKPAAPAPAAPEPPTTTPRKFVAITRTVWMDGGGSQAHTLDAIADDGTAWWMVAGETTWLQTPPLPAREVQANG